MLSKTLSAAEAATLGVGTGGDPRTSGEISVLHRLAPNPVIFDVGANAGQYLTFAATIRPDAQIWCFEPSYTAGVQIDRSKCRRVVPYGLGANPHTATLYTPYAGSGLASLTQRRLDHFGISMKATEEATIVPLDLYLRLEAPEGLIIDLLKLDIEGHELAALQGSIETLRAGRIRLVQFEFGGCNIDTRTFLQDFYYFFKPLEWRIARILPNGQWLEIEPYSELFEQFRCSNYVAYPAGHLAR